MDALENFGRPWLRTRLLFPKLLIGFCCNRLYESAYKILKFVASPVSEIRGGTLKLWAAPGSATLPFLKTFNGFFVRMDPVNLPAKFEVHSGYVKTWGSPWIRRSSHPRSLILAQSKARMRLPISPS